MADKLIVGIDISKDWLDLCASNAAGVERIANTPEVVAAWLERVGAGLIAFEPTGGYERTLIAAARERGIAFVRVHPNVVIAFRKSRGIKAKTDAIDARLRHSLGVLEAELAEAVAAHPQTAELAKLLQ